MANYTYTTYQCSVCRRVHDVATDDVRAVPNQCTITKNCAGRLFKIGGKNLATSTLPKEGVEDWYPRGQHKTASPVAAEEQLISLSCSNSGVVTLAVFQTDVAAASRDTLDVTFIQQRTEQIPFVQYLFKIVVQTISVSGKDATNKNVRFDQAAINEQRVFVRVDGVLRSTGPNITDIVLTPNTVTFNAAVKPGSVVDVSVFQEQNLVEKTVTFNANYANVVNANSGSWGNIRWVRELTPTLSKKWWLYSCSTIASLGNASRLSLKSISTNGDVISPGTPLSFVRFLLSATPHENIDRYLQFYIDGESVSSVLGLSITTATITEMFVSAGSLSECYPPMQLTSATLLANSSFVTADTFTSAAMVPSDTSLVRLSGKKIIGPV